MKYLIHNEGNFAVVTAEAHEGVLLPEASDQGRISPSAQAEIFLGRRPIPAPQNGLIFDKLIAGDFNFTENEVNQLLNYVPFFGRHGYRSLVGALFQHSPSHNIWGYTEVQKLYGYDDFWNALLNDDRRIADKFGENGIFPLPAAALHSDAFQPVLEAVKRQRNQGVRATLHVLKGKRFSKSLLKAAFSTALVSSNLEAVREILLVAKDETSSRYSNFAQNLVMQSNHLALAFAVATQQPQLQAILEEYAVPDVQILADLSRRPKLSRLVADFQGFDVSSIPAIEEKPALPESSASFRELLPSSRPLSEVVSTIHPAFSQTTYDDLLPTTQLMAQMTGGISGEEQAYKLSVLFDDPIAARKAIENLSSVNGRSLGHKLGFDLPESATWNPALWRRAILEHTDNAIELMREAEAIGDVFSAGGQLGIQEDVIYQCAQEGSFAPAACVIMERELQDTSHDWVRAFWRELAEESPRDAIKYLKTIPEIAAENNSLNQERALQTLPAKELSDLTHHEVMGLIALVQLRQNDEARYQEMRSLLVNSMTGAFNAGCLEYLESPCTFGVEIEMFGLDNPHIHLMKHVLEKAQPGWAQTEDGSIEPDDDTEGVEMVSPILQSQDVKNLHFAVQAIKALGAKVAGRCALHVHVGITNVFPEEQQLPVIKQALMNYAMLERALSFMDGELTDKYSEVFEGQGLSADQAMNNILDAPHIGALMKLSQPAGRMGGRVNLHAVAKHGTIEFRQHPGTVEPNEVTAWVHFVDKFMAKTVQMAHGGVHKPTPSELCHLEQLVDNYLADRQAEHGGPERRQSSILGAVNRSPSSVAMLEATLS